MTTISSVLIVGLGNMAGAMLTGWLRSGLPAGMFTAVNRSVTDAPGGVEVLTDIPRRRFDAVLLAVKPQQLGDVRDMVNAMEHPEGALMLSVLAGVELDTLRAAFPAFAGHVRAMPNLAAALCKSPVALAAEGLSDPVKNAIDAFMTRLGTAEWISEADYDAVTALAGSGPGFVYRFIDALAGAASELGIAAEQAERLAIATVDGAAALASNSEHSPGELARRVASPGGVTQAGLDVLDDEAQFQQLLTMTLRAATERSKAMGVEARKSG